MASKELTAKVRIDVSDAEKSLDNLLDKINKINSTANKLANGYSDVSKNISKGTTSANKLKTATDAVANSANKVSKSFSTSNGILGTMLSKVKRMASIYLGVMGAKAAIGTSDTITSAENKLNYLNASALGESGYTTGADGSSQYSTATLNATQQAMDKMYVSAQKVRVAYSDMMSNVSKSMTLAGDAFNYNIDNAIRFQEIMGEAYALGGASAAEMSSSMYQLMQALGSGVLQGDELRSVREGAPLAYQAIEQFAQGVYDTTDSLKEMGSQGLITSDIVVAAMMNAGESMDAAFQQTEMTFAQAWTNIKNTAIRAFQPILQQLNDLLNSDVGQSIMANISAAIVAVANIVSIIIQGFSVAYSYLQSFFSWMADNWSWIQYIAIFALSMIVGYLIYMGTQALIAGVKAAIGFLTAHATLLGWLAVIALVIVYIIYLAQTSGSGCEFIAKVATALLYVLVAIFAAVAIAYIATGTLVMSTTMLVVLAIVAVVAILVLAIASYGEEICAYVAAGISVVWNLFVALVTLIISNVIVPLATAWDTFANFFGNILNDPCTTIIRTVESMANAVLGILKNIAECIDAIFGSNLAGAVSGWVSGISSKADELAAKYGNGTYEKKSDLAGKFNSMINDVVTNFTWDTSTAFKQGGEFGKGLQDKINSGFDSVKGMFDGLSTDSILGGIGELGGIDIPTMDNPSMQLNPDDFSNLGNLPNINDALGGSGSSGKGIKGDTGKIADAVDISNEELEYLRKIAEMEWKKEFTTAQIKIDMTNNNNINGESDLDGIVTKLSEKLYEEMSIVANGTYA